MSQSADNAPPSIAWKSHLLRFALVLFFGATLLMVAQRAGLFRSDEAAADYREISELSKELGGAQDGLERRAVALALEKKADRFLTVHSHSEAREEVLYALALARFRLGRLDRCISALESLESPDAAALSLWAHALQAQGRLQEAAARHRQALTADPEPSVHRRSLYALGQVTWRLGHYDEARGAFQRLIEAHPHSDEAKKAKSDLEELSLLGEEAPAGPDGAAWKPDSVGCLVLHSATRPIPEAVPHLRELEGLQLMVHSVDDWEDPVVGAWRVKALPMTFLVVDGRVAEIGLRSPQLEMAAKRYLSE